MKTIDEFIEKLVTIEVIRDEMYGHYPFQIVSDNDSGIRIGALAVNDIRACYDAFHVEQTKGCKSVFMSVDFPGGGDIKNDFVAVFAMKDEEVSVLAIPYNPETGEIFDRITESTLLDSILKEAKQIID